MYSALLTIVTMLGWLPASAFILIHRPARWRSLVTWDASGWVIVIWLLYTWNLYRIFISMTATVVSADRIVGLGIGLAIDVVVWLRLVHWLRFYRRNRTLDHED